MFIVLAPAYVVTPLRRARLSLRAGVKIPPAVRAGRLVGDGCRRGAPWAPFIGVFAKCLSVVVFMAVFLFFPFRKSVRPVRAWPALGAGASLSSSLCPGSGRSVEKKKNSKLRCGLDGLACNRLEDVWPTASGSQKKTLKPGLLLAPLDWRDLRDRARATDLPISQGTASA